MALSSGEGGQVSLLTGYSHGPVDQDGRQTSSFMRRTSKTSLSFCAGCVGVSATIPNIVKNEIVQIRQGSPANSSPDRSVGESIPVSQRGVGRKILPSFLLTNSPRSDRYSIDPAREVGQESGKRDKGNLAGVLQPHFDIKRRISLYKLTYIQKLDPPAMKKVVCHENHEDPTIECSVLQEVTMAIIGFDDNGVQKVPFVARVPEVICDFIYSFEGLGVRNGDPPPVIVPVRLLFGNVERKMVVMHYVAQRKIKGSTEGM